MKALMMDDGEKADIYMLDIETGIGLPVPIVRPH